MPARTRAPWILALGPFAAGCDLLGGTTVEGRLLSEADATAAPIEGGIVSLYDIEGLRLGHDDTAADGSFRIADLPPEPWVATVADAPPDFVPTVFVGSLGSGTLSVPDGSLYALSTPAAADFLGEYGDLSAGQVFDPDTPSDGGCIRGQIWGTDGASFFPVSNMDVRVVTSTGEQYAVYLDEAGVPDVALERTSASGLFAVFHLPAGTWAAVIGTYLDDGSYAYVEVPVMIVEDGVTLLDNVVFQT